ncbi:copper chaperone taha [Dichomitus squalens]|uniref:Copper chaperone taha n=1 Tax=Dichomitus squalens TaxID=114155 RepID=A0A4Q9QDE5_9APHY|nr:copper chaperone taha [Dichomitus squalens]
MRGSGLTDSGLTAQSEHTYKFNVKMTCSGCSGAVDRVLKKTEGVSSYDISLEKQEVIVKGTIPYDDLHAKIAKTGKEVISGTTVE